MSYQNIDVGETERFFTVINRLNGTPIESGAVSYYLIAKTGVNAGKWWRDSDSTWQSVETANTMAHQADGHWDIELSSSPFVDGVKYLEYVKAASGLHVPDSRHLVGQYELAIDASGRVTSSNNADTTEIVAAVIAALTGVEIRPQTQVLGPCKRGIDPLYSRLR